MIDTPDEKLSEFGRFVKAWVNVQQFGGPSQAKLAREAGINAKTLSLWMQNPKGDDGLNEDGTKRNPVSSYELHKLAKVMARVSGRPRQEMFEELVEATLRDSGHKPKTPGWRSSEAPTRKAR